jgi:Ni/Fe-hydrogenase subunit HybB-like protein
MWNQHSFLFEVFWCVILYFTVTAIELSPMVFEKLRAERAARFLHRIAFGVVVVGISLSSLHHTSLGSLFLVTPQRLHPLWYSPFLPLLFILSAMGAGLMFVVLVRFLHAHWYDPKAVFGPTPVERELCLIRSSRGEKPNHSQEVGRDKPMLTNLASIATCILGFYLAVQLVSLGTTDAWRALWAGTWESWLFGAEILLVAVLPILLVWIPRARRSPAALGVAAFSAPLGLALNRLDVGVFGYFRDAGTVYLPSLSEWAVSFGVVAAAGLVFLFFVETFPVFEEGWRERRRVARSFGISFDSLTRVWMTVLRGGLERVSVIAVLVLPLAWSVMYPPYSKSVATPIRPSSGLDVTRTALLIDGNRGGVVTEFPHAEHQERLGGDPSCSRCHHISLPGDETTPCSRCHRHMVLPTLIFDHDYHLHAVADDEGLDGLVPENHTCMLCHASDAAKTAGSAKPCLECHGEDHGWKETEKESVDLARAPAYMEAMHQKCVKCHEEEGEIQSRESLRDCSTCHRSLRPAADALLVRTLPVQTSGSSALQALGPPAPGTSAPRLSPASSWPSSKRW